MRRSRDEQFSNRILLKATNMMRPLALDIAICNEENLSYKLSDAEFRQDGVTVGHDFLRMEGSTVHRGDLNLQLDDTIGKGAFSTVHKAYWKRASGECETVAVKHCSLLDASPDRRKMLLRELRALCQLDHPHLVKFHGAFLQPDTAMVSLVLEYMEMGALRRHIPAQGVGDEKTLAGIGFQIVSGLSCLHQKKILHRDLKTDNVLLATSGYVKLCDFGVSTVLEESGDMGQTLIGTVLFMSPERLRAQPHASQSDIWSLGLILLECWSGQPPWHHQEISSIIDLLVTMEEVTTESLLPRNASDSLRELLTGCLQIVPGMELITCRHV